MQKSINSFERQLCDIQGRLFELSAKHEYASKEFIAAFMNSETADNLDRDYDRLQWLGEEYILANFADETHLHKGDIFSNEVLYWIGYTYRYWHFLTGESSKTIYTQADVDIMNESYFGFHTLDVAMAVVDLKELYKQKSELN
ncbi:MAG: hypothetical protein ACYCYM_06905 [Saccharofermentanales bacterium]